MDSVGRAGEAAVAFQDLLLRERVIDAATHRDRQAQIHGELAATGSYRHTPAELEYACRVAWRANPRCIGRLPWATLRVLDRRDRRTPAAIFHACVEHLRLGTNDGRIRSVMTVFAPDEGGGPDGTGPAPRIWNSQLIRFAGWRRPDGSVLGDPAQLELTLVAHRLGWFPAQRTAFTVLPVIIQVGGTRPELFELPSDAVRQVPITHPEFDWFAELGLRWHAVPMVSNLALEAGGLRYPAAPFNGWYMSTEIASRNLADVNRYNQLPVIARRMGLDTGSSISLWRDRAMVELNIAVLHSFRSAGIHMVDHHSAAEQFMRHLEREEAIGRAVPGDWSWLVPPMSGSTTPVFHRYYDSSAEPGTPSFVAQPDPWRSAAVPEQPPAGCPAAGGDLAPVGRPGCQG